MSLKLFRKSWSLCVKDSLSPVKVVLANIFSRLQLKEKQILSYAAATAAEISDFWSAIIAVDATLEEGGRKVKSNIGEHTDISEFIHHCCWISHYTFDILKCRQETCKLCRPFSLPKQVFDRIKQLPFPVPGEDGHYKAFSDVFGSDASEEF